MIERNRTMIKPATNNEIRIEYDLFADIWKLFKSYYHKAKDKDFWSVIMNEAREIEKKYNSSLCNDLLVAVIMELENKYQKEREELT